MKAPYNRVAIWDLDATLADCRHRLHFITERNPPDWDAFHNLTLLDKPIPSAVVVFNSLRYGGLKNIICTARPESNRIPTQAWLNNHGLEAHDMLMRATGDSTHSAELKKIMVDIIRARGFDPIVAFEDHPLTVQMYRENGVPCWAADDANWRGRVYKEVKQQEQINA